MRRRHLKDLYVRGREFEINDGAGEGVKVWIQKINEIDREAVLRRANAAKSRFMLDADDEEGELFASMYGTVREFDDREDLITILIGDEIVKYRRKVEARLAGDDETWGKDGHLQGLTDAWLGDDDNPGLAAIMAEDPEDPEGKRVLAELERFEAQVLEESAGETQRLHDEWEAVPNEKLWREVTHKLLERRSDSAWMREYERQQLFFSVRDPEDHHRRYFEKVNEIDDLDDAIRKFLIEKCNSLAVDPDEGKESRANQDSSISPESPSVVAVSEASGLQAVTA
jgi:hypothetical protein